MLRDTWFQRDSSGRAANACRTFCHTYPLGDAEISGYRCCVRKTGDDPCALEQCNSSTVVAASQRTARPDDLLHDLGNKKPPGWNPSRLLIFESRLGGKLADYKLLHDCAQHALPGGDSKVLKDERVAAV